MAQESIRSPVPRLSGKACSPRRSACLAALLLAACVGPARGAGLDLAFTFTDPAGDGGEWGDLVQVDVYYSSETGDFEVIMTADAAAPFVGSFRVTLRAVRQEASGGTTTYLFFRGLAVEGRVVDLLTPRATLSFTGKLADLSTLAEGDAVSPQASAGGDGILEASQSATVRRLAEPRPFVTLGFDGPTGVVGSTTATVTREYLCTLRHSGPETGPRAWSLGVAVASRSERGPERLAVIRSISIAGTDAGARFTDGSQTTELTAGEGNEGAVSVVRLSSSGLATLEPNATSTVARIEVEFLKGAGEVTLRYVDGLLMSTSGPVEQRVETGELVQSPALPPPLVIPAVVNDPFLRGDLDQDGEVTIGDVSHSLEVGFCRGELPCWRALDVNGDFASDHSDVFNIVNTLFMGAPSLPFEYVDVDALLEESLSGTPNYQQTCDSYSPVPVARSHEVVLDFGDPGEIVGSPGEAVVVPVRARLLPVAVAAEAWSFGIAAAGCEIVAATEISQGNGSFRRAETSRDGRGAVSANVRRGQSSQACNGNSLPPGVAEEVVELEVRVTVPPTGCQECVLSYVEGLQGSGQPVLIRARTIPAEGQPGVGRTIIPATESLTFRVCSTDGGGVRVPGDCNQDGSVDISDGICLLGFLFLGSGPLPCGDGSASDAANLRLLDGNGDGGIDLSDAVRLFQYLFTGGPPHVLGAACITIPGCPAPAISPNCDGTGP